MVAVSYKEILRTRKSARSVGVAIRGCTRSQVECLLQRLVTLPENFLADVSKVADFTERPRDMGLPARDENAGGDDGL